MFVSCLQCCGMSKRFRTCSLDQPFLLPPSLQDWLPENHLARFVADVVRQLDLSEIYHHYEHKDGRGLAAYHPEMLTRLLLYGYAIGESSSRRIEQATYDDVAFRYLAADQHPDHDTIAGFRQQHLESLARLFVQALRLCQKAGLVKLRHVAIDGTKLEANACLPFFIPKLLSLLELLNYDWRRLSRAGHVHLGEGSGTKAQGPHALYLTRTE